MKHNSKLYEFIIVSIALSIVMWGALPASGGEGGISGADKKTVLKIGYGDYPPVKYYSRTKEGEHRGVVLEMIKSILEKKGYRVEFYTYPWNRVLHLTRTGELDMILCIAPNEAPDLKTNNVVFQRVKYGVYVSKNNPWKYTGEQSLKTIGTLGIQENYDYGDAFMAVIKKHPDKFQLFTEDNTIVRFAMMMEANRLSGFIEDMNVTKFHLAGTGHEDAVQLAGVIEYVIDAYVGFSPKLKSSNVKKLTKILDEGARNFYRSGRFVELLKKEGIYDSYYPLFKDLTK